MENLVTLAVIAIGIFYCFFGYRFFRIALIVLGFVLGALLGASLSTEFISQNDLVIVMMGAIGGIFGGVILPIFYTLGVFIMGASFGIVAFRSLVAGFDFSLQGPEVLWVLGAAIVGGALALFLLKYMIIIATALIGAANIVGGLAILISDSFDYNTLSDQEALSEETSALMMVAWLLIALAGAVTQIRNLDDDEEFL